jgi:hypothetical protein
MPAVTPDMSAGAQQGRQALGNAGVFSPTPTPKPAQTGGVDVNKMLQTLVDRLHQSSPAVPAQPQPMDNDWAGRLAAARANSQMIRLPTPTSTPAKPTSMRPTSTGRNPRRV